jgi:carbonic anhydrase
LQPGDMVKTSATNKLKLSSLFPKKLRMFRYTGSKTMPPCVENVIWTVFSDPLPVSKNQMAKLRKINTYNNKPILGNYRPVKPTFTAVRKKIFFLRQLKTN